MTNGLCLSDMFLSRGSCTDKSYKSSNCAQVCTKTNPGGGVGVRPCGYDGTWDCGNGSTCDTGAIKINTGNFVLTNAQLHAMGAEMIPSSSSAPAASTAPTSTSSSTAAPATVTPTGLVQATQVTAVGAGVGIPLGLLAASFLALWLFERRKSSKLKQQIAFEHQQFQQAPGAGPIYQNAGINRIPSQHSIMSSLGARNPSFGQAQPPMPLHPALRQDSYSQNMQPTGMQRMMSTSSQQHSVWQNQNVAPGTPPPPPPPPKAFQHSWPHEAPAEEVVRPQRSFSNAQELPTDR